MRNHSGIDNGAGREAGDTKAISGAPVPKFELWLVRVTIAASALYAVAYIALWSADFDGMNDFFVFWSAARWVAERGYSPQIYDAELFRAFQAELSARGADLYRPFAYPPSGLMLFSPLGVLRLGLAMVVFLAVTLGLYLAAVAWGGKQKFLALLSSPAVLLNVVIGQNGFLSAGLLVGGLRLAARRPWLAGGLLGLLTIKPQLGLLVPVALVAAGHWRCVLGASLSALALLLASLALGGADLWHAWLELLPVFAENTAANVDTASRLMISPAAALVTLGFEYSTARLVQIPVTLIVIVAVWKTCRRHGLTPLTIAAVCAGTLLATPFAYFYDLTIATAAVMVLAGETVRSGARNGESAILLLAWALPLLGVSDLALSAIGPVVLGLLFWATLRRI